MTHCAVTHGLGRSAHVERTTGDDVRRRHRHHRLTADQHARVRRGRLRLTAVRAHHRRADMQNESGHENQILLERQVITSAPWLTVTVGPTSTSDAPLPF